MSMTYSQMHFRLDKDNGFAILELRVSIGATSYWMSSESNLDTIGIVFYFDIASILMRRYEEAEIRRF